MKFVDEAIIKVESGKGGKGIVSFRREKYIPFGGPDGGDGGDGGSVYLQATSTLNTLVDFRHSRFYKAENGQAGQTKEKTGRKGDDLIIPVPIGTMVFDRDTEEFLGDLTKEDASLLVAKGGFHGLGNTRYKSSTNRAPRQHTSGDPVEIRSLSLELKVLADVGLLGLPNAGKSTFIRSVSAATPKVADYPFTTMYPNLGVVSIDPHRSFVVADIPGIIEGASEGAGLGIQFLKHVSRSGLLLHMVDMAPYDDSSPADSFLAIENELQKFDPKLVDKERWLVINKIDLVNDDYNNTTLEDSTIKVNEVVKSINWQGPVFVISAIKKIGTDKLCRAIMDYLEVQNPKHKEKQEIASSGIYDPVSGKIIAD